MFQLLLVKISVAGETCRSHAVSPEETATVTLAIGWVESLTVQESVLPAPTSSALKVSESRPSSVSAAVSLSVSVSPTATSGMHGECWRSLPESDAVTNH